MTRKTPAHGSSSRSSNEECREEDIGLPGEMKKAAVLLAILAVAGFIAYQALKGKTILIALTQSEIQAALDKRFPVEKGALIFKVRFSDPVVRLRHGSEKIHFEVSAGTNFTVADLTPEGRGLIEAGIGYRPEEGEFILLDPELDLQIKGLSEEKNRKIVEVSNLILSSYVSEFPVYRLSRADVKQNMARLVLRDVRVDSGVLKITLGL